MSNHATPPAQPHGSRSNPAATENQPAAGLWQRFASMFYEALLLTAVLFLASFLYLPVFGVPQSPFQRAVFQFYLFLTMLVYFTYFWSRSGQTLPMKTWRIKLIARQSGTPLNMPFCILRFFLAGAGLLLFGSGLIWAFFDPDRQFLHDRLLGSQLIRVGGRPFSEDAQAT